MIPCDPKEYRHLLYDKRKFKGRIENSSCVGRFHFYILKSVSSEEQSRGEHNHYHVALLNTGELVCVDNGYSFIMDGVRKDKLYIGEGVVHHNEYW